MACEAEMAEICSRGCNPIPPGVGGDCGAGASPTALEELSDDWEVALLANGAQRCEERGEGAHGEAEGAHDGSEHEDAKLGQKGDRGGEQEEARARSGRRTRGH